MLLEQKDQWSNLEHAKNVLMSTLDDRRKEIMALRTLYQSVSLNASSEVVKKGREVFVEQQGDLEIIACFFQMSDDKVVLDHSAALVIDGHLEGVRGFNVEFEKDGLKFDCFIFDPAGNRTYYDRKTDAEKKIFLENHVQRSRRGYAHRIEKPDHLPFYTAFINDENGAYALEEIAFVD